MLLKTRNRVSIALKVPYTLKNKVEEELNRLEKQGVIESCQFSDWAAPIVPVLKQDGSIRICGDYKLTINRVAKLDTYPLHVLRICLPRWQEELNST